MRWSQFYLFTTREVPNDAEVVSHQLMVRAGMIRKAAAGIYTYLPLGWRSIMKMMDIVRREMDAAGAVELMMPAIHPAELWKETDRWDVFGDLLLKMKDRNQRDFCFGPTHEEVVTDAVRHDVKQLSAAAVQPLSDPGQVSRRDPSRGSASCEPGSSS